MKPIPANVAALLQAGKLEQMCPECGRWEAAGPSCSWCLRPIRSGDWYRNDDASERGRRLPARPPSVAPASRAGFDADPVPLEYRGATRDHGGGWPAKWGPSPYARKAASPPPTPVEGADAA